mmetsp:Transcript_61386/g.146605  ORF Transcript_61386/g.146605 Transcript_61386/m.146605 type:complete len:301 (-) Transcript_61386:7-909(-)
MHRALGPDAIVRVTLTARVPRPSKPRRTRHHLGAPLAPLPLDVVVLAIIGRPLRLLEPTLRFPCLLPRLRLFGVAALIDEDHVPLAVHKPLGLPASLAVDDHPLAVDAPVRASGSSLRAAVPAAAHPRVEGVLLHLEVPLLVERADGVPRIVLRLKRALKRAQNTSNRRHVHRVGVVLRRWVLPIHIKPPKIPFPSPRNWAFRLLRLILPVFLFKHIRESKSRLTRVDRQQLATRRGAARSGEHQQQAQRRQRRRHRGLEPQHLAKTRPFALPKQPNLPGSAAEGSPNSPLRLFASGCER